MDTTNARRRAWADPLRDNRLAPARQPAAPTPGEPATEEEALCRQAEAHEQQVEDAECGSGCDHPEGPLPRSGCPW